MDIEKLIEKKVLKIKESIIVKWKLKKKKKKKTMDNTQKCNDKFNNKQKKNW